MSRRVREARGPSAESTQLAWLCGVPEAEVHQAARVLGISLSRGWFRSLASMARIAYHLGVVVGREAARGVVTLPQADSVNGRALLWCRMGGPGDKACALWGVDTRTGEVVVRTGWAGDDEVHEVEWVECTHWTAEGTVGEWVAAHNRAGERLRPASWLIPLGTP